MSHDDHEKGQIILALVNDCRFITALITQIVVATLITILLLRWQERAALGRNRAVS